jgi:hypothetical protein
MGYLGYKPADKPLTSADITDSIITSAKIVDGTIVNADISNSSVTSNYYWVNYGVILLSDSSVNQTVAGTYNSSTTSISQPAKASSNAGVSGYINIADPLNTSTYKQSYGQFLNERNDANYHYFLNFGLHNKNSTSALSGVDFYFTSGNISSGNFKLYGLK